jgi:hypothetical protein
MPLIDMIQNDWAKPRSVQEKTIMIARARTARMIITCAYGIMLAALFVTLVTPLLGMSLRYITNITDPGKPLPLQAHYVYDVTRSPQYEIAFASQAIAMFFSIMPYTGVDNFLGLLVFHVSGQLDILRNHITRLDIVDLSDTLKIHVLDHTRLLRY